MPNSSSSGGAGGGDDGTTIASECAPHPWSTATTRPSSGAYSLAQTPNACRSAPASCTKNPHVAHAAGAARAIGASGPGSPEYHRSTAATRPFETHVPGYLPGVYTGIGLLVVVVVVAVVRIRTAWRRHLDRYSH